jgi:hypothetical protein
VLPHDEASCLTPDSVPFELALIVFYNQVKVKGVGQECPTHTESAQLLSFFLNSFPCLRNMPLRGIGLAHA